VVPALLYVVAVFYMGSISVDPPAEMAFDWSDKVLHALAFGGMQLILARALRFSWPEVAPERVAVHSTLAATAFGGLLELWQAALPHRSADFWDFLADAVGAGVAGLFWWGGQRSRAPGREVRRER
jgi:VanZ family protein